MMSLLRRVGTRLGNSSAAEFQRSRIASHESELRRRPLATPCRQHCAVKEPRRADTFPQQSARRQPALITRCTSSDADRPPVHQGAPLGPQTRRVPSRLNVVGIESERCGRAGRYRREGPCGAVRARHRPPALLLALHEALKAMAIEVGASPDLTSLLGRSKRHVGTQSSAATVSARSSDRIDFPLAIGRRNVAAIIAEPGTTMTVEQKDDRAQTGADE
jgi:hypothetical protein